MAKRRIQISYQTSEIAGKIYASGSCLECGWNLKTELRKFKRDARTHVKNVHDALPYWRGSKA
jgi:ABC-type uncharacterized transport system auxiliary subunit